MSTSSLRRAAFAGVLLLAVATMTAALPTSDSRFPAVEGRNLEGRRFSLPGDFEGERNLVLVAFEREQQADVDSWLPTLRPLLAADPRLRVYELPTLGRGYTLIRPVIDGGMRKGIPDRAVREATITLYLDKEKFRRALAIPDERSIHLFVVDRAGRIAWRTNGRYSATALASLERALAR